MPFIELLGQQAAGQAAGNFINEGMGLLFAGPKRKAQLKTAKGLQELQIKGNKELTDYNMAKQLEMWKNTSYPAQMEMMKQAGLNPALMYGMGGGGGQTAQVAQGSVGGQGAETPKASTGNEGMGLMIGQMGLLKAQKENIEADTKQKLANIPKTETETKSLLQGIENQKAVETLTHLQAELQRVQNSIARQTIVDAMQQIETTAKKSIEELRTLKLQNNLSEEQFNDKVKLLREQVISVALNNLLTKAQTEKTQSDTQVNTAQIAKWAEEISQGWEQLDQNAKKIRLEGIMSKIEADRPYIWFPKDGTRKQTKEEFKTELENLINSIK